MPAQELLSVSTCNLCTRHLPSAVCVGRDLGRPYGPTSAQSRVSLNQVARGRVPSGLEYL